MLEDTEIIVALLGLVAVGVGALFSGVGFFLRVRAERLKTRRRVLFYLLEIRQAVKVEHLSANVLAEQYFSHCLGFFESKGIDVSDGIPDELKVLIQAYVCNQLESSKPALDDSFLSSFEQALSALSIDDPILAYQLRGRASLKAYIQAQGEYLADLTSLDSFSQLEAAYEPMKDHAANLSDEAADEIIRDIESDIRRVAWRCGFWTRAMVQAPLRSDQEKVSAIDTAEIDARLEEALKVIVTAVQASQEEGEPVD